MILEIAMFHARILTNQLSPACSCLTTNCNLLRQVHGGTQRPVVFIFLHFFLNTHRIFFFSFFYLLLIIF
jgi:hypothetical protein